MASDDDATPDRDESLLRVLDAYLQAVESGAAPDRQQWLAQHPEFSADLSQFLNEQDRLMKLTEPLHAFAPGAGIEPDPDRTANDRDGVDDHGQEPNPPIQLNGAGECTARRGTYRFGDYELLEEIAHGGMGTIFKARQRSLNRIVAIKLVRGGLLASDDDRRRFRQEAEAVAALDHPNIVPIYEVGEHEGLSYFSMKLATGGSLARRLPEFTTDPRSAARLVATVARAIQHAHERGILHRDLKPSNIVIDEHGQPQVSDFGLAKRMAGDSELTQSGAILGTPSYMAPEQAASKKNAVGIATDVYGLGAVLYTLLIGRPPFQGDSVLETIEEVKTTAPDPPSGINRRVDRDLQTICLKCLEKEPERRYSSAQAVADDLERFLSGEPIVARRPRLWEKVRRQVRKHAAALVVFALVSLFAFLLLAAKSNFESHVDETRKSARRSSDEVRNRERTLRLALYDADIRQAARYLRGAEHQMGIALLERHLPRSGEEDQRGFAWHYLWRRFRAEWRALDGHRGDVYYVEFSPRGELLASAGKDGTVRIWETSRWQLVRKIVAAQTEVNVAAFAPDGETLATVDDDGRLKLWEISTGHCRFERVAHKGDAVVAKFATDGKTIVTGGRRDGLVKIWDRTTGALRESFRATDGLLENFSFSPDASILATAGQGGFELWKWPAKSLIVPHAADMGTADGVAFSHDGRRLATAHEGDNSVRLWDVPSGRPVGEFRGHTQELSSVAFSVDDRTILSTGSDETIRLWDASTGAVKAVHNLHAGKIWNLAASPDGHTVAAATADGTVWLWDRRPPPDFLTLPTGNACAFAFTSDGRSLVVFEQAEDLDSTVSRWDAQTGSFCERKRLNVASRTSYAHFSANGHLIAVNSAERAITLCDWASSDRQTVHGPAQREIRCGPFSPDERFLLVQARNSETVWLIWDLTRQCLMPLPWGGAPELRWAPSGELLASLGGGRLAWWNPRTDATKNASVAPHREIDGPTISPDGRRLAATDRLSQKIRVWSVVTLQLEREFGVRIEGPPWRTFSRGGRTLATYGENAAVRLWDVATGEELFRLEGDKIPIGDVVFSPDGRAVATRTADGTGPHKVYLWLPAKDEAKPVQLQSKDAASSKRSREVTPSRVSR
jgi:WD40 repeat protein/serine/threonine protein kinase